MPSKRKQAEKLGAAARGGSAGTVAMVLAAVLICAAAIALIFLIDRQPHPGEATTDTAETEEAAPGDLQRIEEQLKELFPEELEYVGVPKLEDREAFEKYVTKNTYYRECTVSRSDGLNQTSHKLRIIRDGRQWNIETIEGDVITETIIADGERACIINEITGERSYCPLGGEFTVESLVGLTSHDEILTLVSDYYAGGERKENTGLSSLSMLMFRTKGANMLVLNLSRTDTGAREAYYYYLDYGCIYHNETTMGGATLFSITTTVFDADISELVSEDTFVIPEE